MGNASPIRFGSPHCSHPRQTSRASRRGDACDMLCRGEPWFGLRCRQRSQAHTQQSSPEKAEWRPRCERMNLIIKSCSAFMVTMILATWHELRHILSVVLLVFLHGSWPQASKLHKFRQALIRGYPGGSRTQLNRVLLAFASLTHCATARTQLCNA